MRTRTRGPRSGPRLLVTGAIALGLMVPATAASAQVAADPRQGLEPGLQDAETAAWNTELVAHLDKPVGFFDPANPVAAAYRNSDLAFSRNHAFVGQYAGTLIYDISDPENPELRTAVSCPGGQGDISVLGNLMFVGVQELGTVDCSPRTAQTPASEIFNGVRIFDISDLDMPRQVAAVQTCRGSHTHTVVEDLDDPNNVYVYVNGTSGVRDASAIEGLDCVVGPTVAAPTPTNPDRRVPSSNPADFLDANGNPVETDRYQIEVIRVPVNNPEDAEIIAEPRLFADEETGNPVGLLGQTDACHDITAYPEIGLAAGACEGNGLLIDIRDPANPKRIDYVEDQTHFAYWHSATFNNDGTKVVFTDELGGGGAATCVPGTDPNDGANAIFDIVDTPEGPRLQFASYWKIPIVQTATENCVAHNGSIIPVPGRDLMVQAWYQGGWSVMDFTDSDNPVEIAFFDRGPIDAERLLLGGYWSTYWYNGRIYGTEIARGFDVFRLLPSQYLSAEEIAAAEAVRQRDFTPQSQTMITDANRSACGGVEPVSFPDVGGPPHADNVECIAGYGIARGFADGRYGPARDVTREQMAGFISRMMRTAGVELPASAPDAFRDDNGTTHELAINQLAALGVVRGKTADLYLPAAPVSREEMASLVIRAVEHIHGGELPSPRSPFTDVPSGGTHTEAIDKAHAAGIVLGVTPTTYNPKGNVTREQMASYLARSLELLFQDLVELNEIV